MIRLAFGCMRLPMNGNEVDKEHFTRMVDAYMEAGFNYFDTAHGYIDEKSEPAIRDCVSARYPRESFILTDKLTENYFECEEDFRPFFEKQLELCGVEYFDYYLMHAQNSGNYEKFTRCRAYEVAAQLKAEGKIRHVGISFHDNAETLDRILTDHPEVEAVQIQFNYLDYEDEGVQSRKCYEVCRKHGKDVLIMEPVRGGRLVDLPDGAKRILDGLGDGNSYASYAIRFAASFDGVISVLSGMSNMEQMLDNISYMKDFKPLDEREMAAVREVAAILRSKDAVSCTGCRYCVADCPMQIDIPAVFGCLNAKRDGKETDYEAVVAGRGRASDCVECGGCEKVCPQHLPIRKLLKQSAEVLE